MSWSRLSLFVLLLVVIFATSVFGAHYGYTVNGVPKGGEPVAGPSEEDKIAIQAAYNSGIFTLEEYDEAMAGDSENWLASGLTYFIDMVSFKVDGMPEIINTIFLVLNLLCLYLFVTMFLPGGGG